MRILPTFLIFGLVFFTFSCVKEEGRVVDGDKPSDVLSAYTEEPSGDEETRTKLSGTNLVWEDGDKITVVGTSTTEFTLDKGAGTPQGTFVGTFKNAGNAPYYALMPTDANAVVTSTSVSFNIPQEKAAWTGNISQSANPIAAKVGSGGTGEFKNLFGLLKLTVKVRDGDPDVTIKKITLHDLGGNMLWGTCSIPVNPDGSLDCENIALSGGDNSISMVWKTSTTLSTTAKSIYFAVPPGALDNGFSVVFYDRDGRAWTFLQKISTPVAAVRSKVVVINTTELYEKSEPLDVKARGYYKTLFVDGGRHLNHLVSTDNLPWIETMGLQDDFEYLSCSNTREQDSIMGLGIIVSAPRNEYSDVTWEDQNGVLLYPDGKPRFRAVYVNGGSSKKHGRYLSQDGRDRFHDFYYKGGSYLASCAGTFLATKYVDGSNCYNNSNPDENYTFGIWPGVLYHTNMPVNSTTYGSIWTSLKASADFGDFASGDTVEMVRHHGGSYLPNTVYNKSLNPQPERLFTYQYTQDPSAASDSTRYNYYNLMHYAIFGKGSYKTRRDSTSVWAYKNSSTTGRAVLCGSHPEDNVSSSQMLLMSDMMNYALAGSGSATLKATLTLGEQRVMNTEWSDGTPSYAKIGDRQYHHFKLDVPSHLENFILTLDSDYDSQSGIDLYLALRRGGVAWISDADYVLCNKGGKKTFRIKTLPAGTWYIGVYCATTVTATKTDYDNYRRFFKYSGKTQTQNGIAYSILASVESDTKSTANASGNSAFDD